MPEIHTHKYKRILIGKKDFYVYKCILNGCPHYLPYQAAIGRATVCHGNAPNCKKTLFITEEHIRQKTERPICEACKEFKKEQKEVLVGIPMIEEGDESAN